MTSKHQRIALVFALLCAPAVYAQVAAHTPAPAGSAPASRLGNRAGAQRGSRTPAGRLDRPDTRSYRVHQGTGRGRTSSRASSPRAGGDLFPVCYDEEGTRPRAARRLG